MTTKQRLEELFGEIHESEWIAAAIHNQENQQWLNYSQEIVISVLERLDQINLTRIEFAKRMDVSPQLVDKWVSGKEKLTLEIIAEIESVLGIRLG